MFGEGDEESCESVIFQQRTVRVRAGEGSVDKMEHTWKRRSTRWKSALVWQGPFTIFFFCLVVWNINLIFPYNGNNHPN